jgi:hypothetical protein
MKSTTGGLAWERRQRMSDCGYHFGQGFHKRIVLAKDTGATGFVCLLFLLLGANTGHQCMACC